MSSSTGALTTTTPKVHVRPEEEARAASVPVPAPAPNRLQSGGWWRYPDSKDALALREAEAKKPVRVPSDFGVPSGSRISNYDTILDDTWRALGSNKQPAIVYILVKGMTGFAHAAVAYRYKGELTTMNIIGKTGQMLVNHLPLKEYLFGTTELDHFDANYNEIRRSSAEGGPWRNPEGGAYHRDHELFVVWDWPDEKIEKMHAYFVDINRRQKARDARFRLVPGPWRDAFDKTFHKDPRESGNCALWTSRGLVEAGVLSEPSMWPKETAVRLLHGEGRTNPDNMDIVAVPWIPHARRTHLADDRMVAMLPWVKKKLKFYKPQSTIMISPFTPMFDKRYVNLSERAGARIVVDPGTTVARVERKNRAYSRL